MEITKVATVKKQYRFDEYLGIFSSDTAKRIVEDLEKEMGIGTRAFQRYRYATYDQPCNIDLNKLGAAASVFAKYMEQPLNINDLIN